VLTLAVVGVGAVTRIAADEWARFGLAGVEPEPWQV